MRRVSNRSGGSVSTQEQLAWAAGLFEGEGCFTRSKQGPYGHYPQYKITMLDKEPVHRFWSIVGVGTFSEIEHAVKSGASGYVWRCGRRADCEYIKDLLWPWLSSRRRAAASTSLER